MSEVWIVDDLDAKLAEVFAGLPDPHPLRRQGDEEEAA